MDLSKIIIAIDGYSSTGKSSFAKLVAKEFGLYYMDSGAMYRCVTLYALENGWITSEGINEPILKANLDGLHISFAYSKGVNRTYIDGKCVERKIRSMKVSSWVSPIATLSFVRDWVDSQLHIMGANGGFVMDGRDIGTTVFPNADLKVFMTASPEVRAQRRMAELQEKGDTITFEEVLKNLEERDYIDSHRAASPLRQAPDALVLDNSNMTFDDQLQWIREKIQAR